MRGKSLKDKVLEAVSKPDWLPAWRSVAIITDGLLPDDPRLPTVKKLIGQLDAAFFADDFGQFENYVAELKTIVGRD